MNGNHTQINRVHSCINTGEVYKLISIILGVLCSTAVLLGCEKPKTPTSRNSTQLASQIQDELTKQSGATVESVSCPQEVSLENKNGSTLECQATIESKTFPVELSLTPEGQYQWKSKGVVLLSQVEKEVEKGVKEQAKVEVTTDCGGKLKLVKTGEVFECRVKSQEGETAAVKVTVMDEYGGVSWKL